MGSPTHRYSPASPSSPFIHRLPVSRSIQDPPWPDGAWAVCFLSSGPQQLEPAKAVRTSVPAAGTGLPEYIHPIYGPALVGTPPRPGLLASNPPVVRLCKSWCQSIYSPVYLQSFDFSFLSVNRSFDLSYRVAIPSFASILPATRPLVYIISSPRPPTSVPPTNGPLPPASLN